MKSLFEDALEAAELVVPGNLPRALPLGHTSKAQHFAAILKAGQLEPQADSHFLDPTLYLFYGSLSYRIPGGPTVEATSYPVGFLFAPVILSGTDVHFPFDTGAIMRGICRSPGTSIESFRVAPATLACPTGPHDCPRLIVKHLFGSNANYLKGQPSSAATGKPEPIPTLLRFLLELPDETDHRRACVETQRRTPVPLDSNLLWMGYPDIFEQHVQEFLREHEPNVPFDTWSYSAYGRFRPSDLCGVLQGRASVVLDRYLD
jgi:hypothetical protein